MAKSFGLERSTQTNTPPVKIRFSRSAFTVHQGRWLTTFTTHRCQASWSCNSLWYRQFRRSACVKVLGTLSSEGAPHALIAWSLTPAGQICFLKLYHGNRLFSLAEAESILADQGLVPPR